MTHRLANSRASSSRLLASSESAKNAADHLGARAGYSRGFIVESAELDTFQNLMRMSSPCAPCPAAVPRVQEMASTYSLILEGFPFAVAIANLGATSRRTPRLDRSAFGLAGPFGELAVKGVAAPFARILNSNPHNTIRLAAPRLSNSEFAA